jgi:hypothetical protein
MASSGMLRRVALVRTDVSEELSASFIRVTRIGELGTTLAVISHQRMLRRNMPFFIVTAVKTSNLTYPDTDLEIYSKPQRAFNGWIMSRFSLKYVCH